MSGISVLRFVKQHYLLWPMSAIDIVQKAVVLVPIK